MYDDKTVYTDKPGSLNWKFPKPEEKKAEAPKKEASLIQLNSNPDGFSDPPPIVIKPTGEHPWAGVDKEKPVPFYAVPDPVVVPATIV